jgi:hypothetical protein
MRTTHHAKVTRASGTRQEWCRTENHEWTDIQEEMLEGPGGQNWNK